jgi:thiamine biosynthesis lipoprotein
MKRRRFLKIIATGTSALGFAPNYLRASGLEAVTWQGYALGTEGRFTLYTSDPSGTRKLLQACFQEIQHLERCFSLYDHNSQLSRLNLEGRLQNPDPAWFKLLEASKRAHELTHGAFDPSIQPLWQLYAKHYGQNSTTSKGPSLATIKKVRATCGWDKIQWDNNEIRLLQAEARFSFNGIAQGYITDRVSDMLKNEGYHHVLVELGETRALGPHPQQRPWRIGIQNADKRTKNYCLAELDNRALATSASNGSHITPSLPISHLIDPRNGKTGAPWKSISVLAPTATEADALSTGLSFASPAEISALAKARPEIEIITQA